MSSIASESAVRPGIITSDLLIGGVQTAPEGDRYYTTTEAVTGEPIANVAAASVSDARRCRSGPRCRRVSVEQSCSGQQRCSVSGPRRSFL